MTANPTAGGCILSSITSGVKRRRETKHKTCKLAQKVRATSGEIMRALSCVARVWSAAYSHTEMLCTRRDPGPARVVHASRRFRVPAPCQSSRCRGWAPTSTSGVRTVPMLPVPGWTPGSRCRCRCRQPATLGASATEVVSCSLERAPSCATSASRCEPLVSLPQTLILTDCLSTLPENGRDLH